MCVRGSTPLYNAPMTSSTRNSRIIRASRETLYRAFTDPAALAVWLAPGDMTGKVHSFDGRPGGGDQMSLYYPRVRGKRSAEKPRTARIASPHPS